MIMIKNKYQAGMTLIELLIAITIGLFIIGAALMIFQSISGVGSQISEVTQLRQQGMHALRTISKQVNEAGSIEPGYSTDNGNFRFKNTNEYTWLGVNRSPISSWTPPGGGDYLSLSQQVSPNYVTILRNCLGNRTTDGRGSSFYLKTTAGAPHGSLMCDTSSAVNPAQPIIDNVAAFSVRYRVRPSASNINEKRFVDTPPNWSLVDAVEVCLDLIGTSVAPTKTVDGGGNTIDSTYVDCQGNTVSRENRLHVVQRNLFTVYTAQR